eukprot:GGOE01059197.1.p1 GENE.GGOE01059197.1~~GGOE01059197.1.p1  ORF type:complete len:1129 (-),score=273.29 GGOE01059197.1:310-3639(-)
MTALLVRHGFSWATWTSLVAESLWGFQPLPDAIPAVRSMAAAALRGLAVRFIGPFFPDSPKAEPNVTLDTHPDLEIDLDNSGVVLLVQEITMAVTIIAGFLAVAYAILARYAKPPSAEPSTLSAATSVDDSSIVPFLCSVGGLGVTIAGSLLVPATIFTNHLQATVADTWLDYYFSWLTPGLIYGLWDATFWGHCLGVFVVVPFGLFWSQAVGGLLSRLGETLVTLALVSVLHGISQWLLWSVLPASSALLDVEGLGRWVLPFSFSLISLSGSVLLLGLAPRGRIKLLTRIWRLQRPLKVSPHAINALEFELQRLALRLQQARRRCLQGLVHNPQLSALLSLAHIHAIDDLRDVSAVQLRHRLQLVLCELATAAADTAHPDAAPLFSFLPIAQPPIAHNSCCPLCHKSSPLGPRDLPAPSTAAPDAIDPSLLVRSLWTKLETADPWSSAGSWWPTPRLPDRPPPAAQRTPPRPTLGRHPSASSASPLFPFPDLPRRNPVTQRSRTPPVPPHTSRLPAGHRNNLSFSWTPQKVNRIQRAASTSLLETTPVPDNSMGGSWARLLAWKPLTYLTRPPTPTPTTPRSAVAEEDAPVDVRHFRPLPRVSVDGHGVLLNGRQCLTFPFCSHQPDNCLGRPQQSPCRAPMRSGSDPPPPPLLLADVPLPLPGGASIRGAALWRHVRHLGSVMLWGRRLMPSGERFSSRQSTSTAADELLRKERHNGSTRLSSPSSPTSPNFSFSLVDFLSPMGNSAVPSADGRTFSESYEPVTLTDVEEGGQGAAREAELELQVATLQRAVHRRQLQLASQNNSFFATPIMADWLQWITSQPGPAEVSKEFHRIATAAHQELEAQLRFLAFDPAVYLPPECFGRWSFGCEAPDSSMDPPQESDEDVLGQLRKHHRQLRRLRDPAHSVLANLLCLLLLALCVAQLVLSALFLLDASFGEYRRRREPSSHATILDCVMVSWFMAHAVTGLYSTPPFSRLAPTVASTPTPLLLLNILLLLSMSASLPLVSHLLGMTSFNLMSHYSQTAFLSSKFLLRGYSALFVLAELYSLYTFWRDILFRSSPKAMLERTRALLREVREQIGNDWGIAGGIGAGQEPPPTAHRRDVAP